VCLFAGFAIWPFISIVPVCCILALIIRAIVIKCIKLKEAMKAGDGHHPYDQEL
jgi:hypothetical protein